MYATSARPLDRPQMGLARLQPSRPAIEPFYGAAIELPEQIGHVRGDHLDERRRGAGRLCVAEGSTLQDRLLSESDVWRASASDRT